MKVWSRDHAVAWAVLGAARAQFLPSLPPENLRFELENDTGEAIGTGVRPHFSRGFHGIAWDLGPRLPFPKRWCGNLPGLGVWDTDNGSVPTQWDHGPGGDSPVLSTWGLGQRGWVSPKTGEECSHK